MDRNLKKDLRFLIEVDKLKTVYRKIKNHNVDRYENDSEHSYHVTLMALILHNYSHDEIDLLKVIKMLLIHDIVEIDAGDTFAYDKEAYQTKFEREQKAANRIFHLLSEEKGTYYLNLYHEFEAMNTKEAQFANLIDRFQPILLNYLNDGGSWKEHNISKDQVQRRIDPFKDSAPLLYQFLQEILDDYFNEV
ncbi:MAG: HD domain-containing protein [Tissierellia bacterium]|nr:HD domain-containing protein [Tissierellia bacterium]